MAKKIISQAEFISICKGQLINDNNYSEYYEMFSKNVVLFKNIEIIESILLQGINSDLLTIQFEDSSINEFEIDNCKIKNLYIVAETNISEITISQSNILNELVVSSSKINDLIVNNHTNIKILRIYGINSKIVSLHIYYSTLRRIHLSESAISELKISRASRIAKVELCDNSSFDNIIVDKNSICYDFITSNIFVKHKIIITNSVFKKFVIHTNEVIEININESFIQEFLYENYISTTLNMKKCRIMLFLMSEMRTGKDGLIQLMDCFITNLKFDTLYNLSCINIRNLAPLREGTKFKIDSLEESNNELFDMVPFKNEKTAIFILNSDIGKTLFSSDLSKFDRFEFLNSKIIESFIAGNRLPDVSTTNNNNILDQQRIAYNQIKKIYETRGDNVTALDYFAKEMEVYRKQVNNKLDGKIPGESFQLKFNHYTNQHGTQWSKPLFFVFCISLALYLIYYWLLFGFNIDGTFDYKAIPYYFEFLNPTHKTEFIHEFKLKSNSTRETFALLVDYSSRIIIPIFLYQMIQAFRKYGKK